MKFKPIALVVIGVLLGSTITLTLTRPSASTTEILACTNKKSGKTRLTISGECDSMSESKSTVTDLWGLQPTSSTSTQLKALKKHVVDSTGKDLGELISNDGTQSFWILFQGGRFNITSSGYVSGEGWGGDPVAFSDSKCQVPYLWPTEGIEIKSMRTVITAPPSGKPSNTLTARAFKPSGSLVTKPKGLYRYNSPKEAKFWAETFANRNSTDPIDPEQLWKTKEGCQKLQIEIFEEGMSGGLPSKMYLSTEVVIPKYSAPLVIVEK